ncbi:sulfotransferase family protein [Ningiella sp. W23]|uniref:sulfotransferase family protein n=1 Tax=Ningiella sp. W23 TaxID=3023715 RepID=UPI0037566EE0
MSNKVCIVFVCQAGELELKALLFAASLRCNAELSSIDLVAAVPQPSMWGALSNDTEALITSLSIRKVYIDSPFGKAYPIGNKLAAIGVKTDAPVTLFVDSDILCLGKVPLEELLTSNMKAKPADLVSFTRNIEQWRHAYRQVGAQLPSERVLSTVSHELMPPYFNAGFVAVRDGKAFSKTWMHTAKKIDNCKVIRNKRPWLDQIALPVSAKAINYAFEMFDERFNYPAHLKRLAVTTLPMFCHYHSPDIIAQEPVLSLEVDKLCHRYSSLRSLLAKFAAWQDVLTRASIEKTALCKPARVDQCGSTVSTKSYSQKQSNPRDFIITGMPRSGTSMLCKLLNKASDIVIVNEPKEIFGALKDDHQCHKLGLLYRDLRSRVVLNRGINNKVDDEGEVIEDTRFDDKRRPYFPNTHSPNFALATKNPLAYLTRLRVILDSCPNMPVIVMVRNPLDLVTSWKSSFEHLRDIDFRQLPFTDANDPLLDGTQLRTLAMISNEPNIANRRALYLRYLGYLINRERDRIHMIRYEDLIASPQSVLSKVTRLMNQAPLPNEVFESIRAQTKRKTHDSEDMTAIKNICADLALEWGYEV